ncbi:helix-turn-helix domain-containing protein [Celerinatantimonas sp. MCCC 1A17872]|uniref:helix-turn-helix domain-containing protein n=1 Tax=Celerinatantimonas sp. MCCC 1A17872 TaxID=3177514 RepID=UPI0038C6F7B8
MKTGVGGFQPQRLTQAREALGLTKVALATLVNVSSATVTQWESGKQNPQEDKLQALASALGQASHWFLKPVHESVNGAYFYRALSAATKGGRTVTKTKLNWIIELSQSLEKFVDWPKYKLPALDKPFTSISDEEIEEMALEYRNVAGLGSGPIKDLMLSAESSGVICARSEIGYDKLDGLSNWNFDDQRAYILLASDKDNGIRSRFDLAHEIGHMVLHRSMPVEKLTIQNHKEIERQANLFASSLLLPESGFAKELNSPTLETFLTLKPRWKVSMAAMIFRAHSLGILTDLQYSNLYKNLSAKGWRSKEPYDEQVRPEKPKLLHRAVDMLVNAGMSKADLLEILGLQESMIEEFADLPKGFFSDNIDVDNLLAFKKINMESNQSNKFIGNNIYKFER